MAANSGTKYVSVNLNKSYGQHSSAFGSARTPRPAAGAAAAPSSSRPRSSHKAGPKLSVPPPLNLPSLRKEHERFDSLGSGGGPAGPGGSGTGARPSSSGLGWTKPIAEDVSRPVVKPAAAAAAVPVSSAVLRGEDFPSLRATLAPGPGPNQKIQENQNSIQNQNLNQKQKHSLGDENVFVEEKEGSLVTDQFSVPRRVNVVGGGDGGRGSRVVHPKYGGGLGRKQEEYFPGPLPLVRLNPRSDWADDERDTGYSLSREGRDHGFRGEAFWDVDMPRVGGLPHKHDQRGQLRGNEVGKVMNSEVEAYDRMGPEGNSWRSSNLSFPKDAGNERNGVGVGVRPSSGSRDVGKDSNKYVPSPFRDEDAGKRDGQGGKQQPWNNVVEPYGDRNHDQLNRSRADSVQSSVSRTAFLMGGKGLPVNDPLLNFGREKWALPKSEKGFLEDPFMKDFGGSGFDGRDLLGGLVGVVKKKKDVLKQTDFHDPVRESFEAELERVQRMQEQERQRIIEEQERALELARREEEERLRQAREQEERQRRLEEEAREAAWRAEQERIEALRKAEEQRLAREEEKQRIVLEEERRKQAAKQKLLELEQRIARRQAEVSKSGSNAPVVVDEKMPAILNEKEASRATDVGDWEDSERMVDRILTSASSDSSSVNRALEMGSRSHFSRDLSSTFVDRGKPVNSWRRDGYENWNSSAFYPQDQDNSHNSPRRDLSIGGKPFMRKDYNAGAGFVSSRPYHKGEISEPHLDEYAHVKPQRWNQSADGDHLSRNTEIDSDFHENYFERFGDGRTQGHSRGNPCPPFPERTYPNSESEGPYALGRSSRYSVRQPRVLPPPSLGSVHRTYKNENEHPGPSSFLENEMHYNQATRSDSTLPTGYDNGNRGQPEVVDARQETTENEDHKVEITPRCDSQSSLSVSNPPSSPTHLYDEDDLDDSGDSPTILTSEGSKNGPLTAPDNESIATPAGNENVVTPCPVSSGDDDEWTTENNEQFQEQEEYDEDEDYQEEDEVHEGDDHAQLNQDFEDMHLQEKGLPHLMDNLVLGFDEGVQVGMPNEEFERTLKDEETTFMAPQASEECVSYDNARDNGKALQPVNDTSQVNLNSTSTVFQESEKPAQDLVIQPSNSLSPVVSESLVNEEASNGLLTQHSTTPSPVTVAPHYSSSNAPSQAEVPIKLQFGLFSGPSLIPSPVPAIQIGSIQMPLHLHPQVGAPLSHMHPSQPPLFQFGQLRYTSPISQAIMPLGPQSMSFVQPNIPSSFSYSHNPGGQMPVQTAPETSDSFMKNEIRHHSVDSQPGNSRNLPQSSLPSEDAENIAGIKGRFEAAHDPNNSSRTSSFQLDKKGNQNVVGKSSNISSSAKESEVQPVTRDASLHPVSKENFMESKTQFCGRGKRYAVTVKNSNPRSSGPATRVNRPDSGGFMRRPRRNMQRAVTSPTVLPSNSRVVSHGIGPPRSSRSDMQMSHNLTGSDNDCSLFFDKEKHGNETHGHLEDCDAEAEAEAAASAVAVAAISSDEIVGNGLGTCSVPASDGKSFVAADIDRVVAGVGCEQQLANQSRSEEPLSVSLPADLSVETLPISLWPPLPSTQNSSGQMISHFPSVPPHFPSGPPSHFPFYEMNPMMGGPVFAYGPHDESASTTQSQPQKSTTSASRPIGSWQQCHSGVESFYGPPTGFTGPFIAPPGGIPGVQGPPHMVVYNHFAPVGQFGQVGLSFMGTTYIPSGKQPDWKHIPTSSAAGAGEGDINSMNMASSQRNPANIPSPIQHLAPGSPLMPMASPVAMFDVSPFQPSTEMSVQARWSHVPNSQLPLSMPLQQQEGIQTSQFSHVPSVDQPLNAKRFTGSRASTSSEGDRNFPRATDVNVNQLPDELGLGDTSNSTPTKTSAQSVVNKTPSVIPITDTLKVDVLNGNSHSSNNQNASSSFKNQPSQFDHSSGHGNYQRGGISQRNNSGGEWSHRRGYQGRNQSLGSDKNFSSTKVKQIYVAKQTISGASTVS
ncbi:hypothetical protein AAZV13_05G079300 [Glycine max]